jgi:hypothetical protein
MGTAVNESTASKLDEGKKLLVDRAEIPNFLL